MALLQKEEFYADLVVYNLRKITSLGLRIVKWILTFLFIVVFLRLFFQPDKMNEYLYSAENFLTTHYSFQQIALFLSIPFILWLSLSTLPTLVKLVRKFWFYPKSTFTGLVRVPIQSKKMIVHRLNSKSYFVIVQHPYDQQEITFEIYRENYEKLEVNDRVYIHTHPSEMTVFYMTLSANLSL